MITFEKLRWKNFLSTGDQFTELNLTAEPSTLIIGSNGAGKSTLLDALCFALFNKPFRKISKSQLVNSINEKGTVVEVEFNTNGRDYLVRRTIKPGKFEIYENDKLLDQEAAQKDTQKYLEQSILKLNYKSFTQVVILGSSTFVPFMQLSAPHRREVIEDLLDIQIFSIMNSLLKDRIRDNVDRGRDCDHLRTISEDRVFSQEKSIEKLEEVNEERVQEKKLSIDSKLKLIKTLEQDKKPLKKEIESKERELESFQAVNKNLEKLKNLQVKINNKKERVLKELKFFNKNDTCPTCTQTIDIKFKKSKCDELTTESEKFARGLENLTGEIETAASTVAKLQEINSLVVSMKNDLLNIDRDINRYEKENIALERQIDKLQKDRPNIQHEFEILENLKKELSDIEESGADINKESNEFQTVSHLLRDSGIKRVVINKYVPVFNTLINKYLQSMEFYVNFTLDNEFNEVIKSRFRDKFNYASFSEGEKQKIDLALLFTWREVARMKNSASTNLLILDEVFDSSLDDSSTGELLKILRGLETTNLFVISHKGEILVDKFMRTIKFEKTNDFSKMTYDS